MSQLEEVVRLLESFDLTPENCGKLPFPVEQGYTVGQLAIRWLNKNSYLKIPTRKPGRPRVLVEILQNGRPVLCCYGIKEAERRSGYHYTTIYRHAEKGTLTEQGVGFRVLGKECK